MKRIELEEWETNCGDGCCYDYGTTYVIKHDGKEVVRGTHSTAEAALKDALEHLGYVVEYKDTWFG